MKHRKNHQESSTQTGANPPPWIVDACRGAKSRLFRYATRMKEGSGGLQVPAESAESRRESFLWLAGILAAVWIWFWI